MRTRVEQVSCDFCGYGSPWTRPEDFIAVGDVDLCRWCASATSAVRVIECGGHRVTIEADTWRCTCGARYVFPFSVNPAVLAALPSVIGATASVHVTR